MKVFIQKIKGRDRVRIKHGDQIFTIDDYNGYKGDEIEWLKNCVERFFTVYDASVKKSADQSETSSRQQENETKTEIWHKWDSEPDLSYNDAAYGAMLEYASQQTADKDKMIQLQQKHIDEQDQLIYEQVTEIAELKAALSELIRIKDWKEQTGDITHYRKAMPIAWENAIKLIQKQYESKDQ